VGCCDAAAAAAVGDDYFCRELQRNKNFSTMGFASDRGEGMVRVVCAASMTQLNC
jgi:hypothetical protein